MLLVFLTLAASACGAGLVDHPIAADSITYLDSNWVAASSGGLNIPAKVPGDLLSDLHAHGSIGDPIFENNFLNASIWDQQVWSYKTTVTLTAAHLDNMKASGESLLVFDGVKMGAQISINGKVLGVAEDQFLRYEFPLSTALERLNVGSNALAVTFDPSQTVDGRFMACTGGWDWAPYTNTMQDANPGKAHTFSKGIWKSVYLAHINAASASLVAVVPHVFYTGAFPTTPLSDGNHAPFRVAVRVHFYAPAPCSGVFSVLPSWGASISRDYALPQGESNITLNVSATSAQIKLWWPAELGEQHLFNITVHFAPTGGNAVSSTRRVGFRYFALVTGNDTDPAWVAANKDGDGTDRMGMRFRVNGAPLFSRGSNMIPMDELEGRYSAEAHYRLVQSVVEAHSNTLRVWGGGIFYPDVFYDACDELGVILYHDMQFAQQGHSPKVTSTQDREFRHQVRRLSHHPSIVMWDGCNECHVIIGTPTGIYATFVLKVVSEEDQSRVIWPSCPAEGWKAGVNRLSALPNGSPLGLLPQAKPPQGDPTCTYKDDTDATAPGGGSVPASSEQECCSKCWKDNDCEASVLYKGLCWLKHGDVKQYTRPGRQLCIPTGKPEQHTIETHGPYQHGSGFPAVNGGNTLLPFSPNIPISVSTDPTGLGYENVFASEFGSSVMSSFESMSPTLKPEHWGIHGGAPPDHCEGAFAKICKGDNRLAQRNYPCDSLISVYFGKYDFNQTGEMPFKKQLFHCMVAQALVIKQNIETRRSKNEFGIIIWQLNEIWPTGGWGSIEYGNPNFPGQVIGGRWKPLHYWLRSSIFTSQTVSCGNGGVCYVKNDVHVPFTGSVDVTQVDFMTGQAHVLASKHLNLAAGPGVTELFNIGNLPNGSSSILVGSVKDGSGVVVANTVIPLAPPKDMELPKATVTFDIVVDKDSAEIQVKTDRVALYVTFTTLAHGRFSDNAFLLLPPGRNITFLPWGALDEVTLKSTLRVEHVALYR